MSVTASNPFKQLYCKLNESFGSGLISPAPSTSVTPITPMTPLSTPRTPAQILLHRIERAKRVSAIDEPYEEEMKQQELALEMFTNFVDSMEASLLEIAERECEGERVIGPGIVRMCCDLAERVEGLAQEVEERGMGSVYDLMLNDCDEDTNVEYVHQPVMNDVLQHDDAPIYSAFLKDAAESLRSISQEEAQELAEVSLQVAMTAIWTLRTVQVNMRRMLKSGDAKTSPHTSSGDIVGIQGLEQNRRVSSSGRTLRVTWSTDDDSTVVADNLAIGHTKRGLGPVVEILGEEEKSEGITGGLENEVKNGSNNPTKDLQLSSTEGMKIHPSIKNDSHCRCRVLWPPLLPVIQQATQSCIGQAENHPLPATAIGLVCGPTLVTTAVIVGPPILITDWILQSCYNAMSDTPLIANMEKGATNAFQVARLALLCSKLASKHCLAVGERQLQRRGGIHKTLCDLAGGAVDRVMHPVDTIVMAWDGLFWMGGIVTDAAGFVGNVVTGTGELPDMHE